MTVTAVPKDPDALTMTLAAECAASPARVWELWAEPRHLERWCAHHVMDHAWELEDRKRGS